MDELYFQLESLLGSVAAYGDTPTKAESLRIRNKLNQFKKDITGYKQALVAADKVGY